MNPCSRCNGSGTEPRQPSGDEVRAYMRATGWAPKDAGGPAGVLWLHADHEYGIVVAHEMEPGSLEMRSVIERLADREHKTIEAVISAVSAMEGTMTGWRAEARKAPEGAPGRAERQGCGDGSGRREALGRLVALDVAEPLIRADERERCARLADEYEASYAHYERVPAATFPPTVTVTRSERPFADLLRESPATAEGTDDPGCCAGAHALCTYGAGFREGAAAQREQDRQLAIDTHATCTVADSMNPSRLFADLLGGDRP
ncbi:MAG TPA: hypothetical protein VMV92_10120 [Streptosporangiaceae bacterium]|nr:hypothetical protein [Streptosporangiaceae bacterium]